MSKFKAALAASVVFYAVLAMSRASAEDWPQWRGPNRDGKIAGFVAPKTWPKELTKKWTAAIGIGDSTPALVGDKLYTFGRVGAEEVITCFEADSGKIIWQDKYAPAFVVTGPPSAHPGTRSSPAVADGKICALGVGGMLSCLDAATGKVIWRFDSKEFPKTAPGAGTAMSPIIVDGLCIAHLGGQGAGAVMAFDLTTGKPKWKWTGDGPASSSPSVMEIEGTKTIVTGAEKAVVGLDITTGKLLWQFPFAANQGNNATPIIDGQTVIFTGMQKSMLALKIEKTGETFTAKQQWTNVALAARFTTPILKDGMLYGYTAKSNFFCANAKTGEATWTDTANRGITGSLVDAGPIFVATTGNGELAVFEPTDKAFKELARIKVAPTEIWAYPVLSGNRIYIRDKENVTMWTTGEPAAVPESKP